MNILLILKNSRYCRENYKIALNLESKFKAIFLWKFLFTKEKIIDSIVM